MLKQILPGALALMCLCAPALAEPFSQEYQTLGYGRLFNNDHLGDGGDRWQTGSYNISVVRGTGWEGAMPAAPLEVIEYRIGSSIIAPSDLRSPPPGDRRYAGRLHLGANTYFDFKGLETRLGAELVAVGPDTGVSGLHEDLHRIFSSPRPVVAANQLPNHLYPVLSGEIGRPLALGRAELRPFAEARLGDEDLLRAGVDLSFGAREAGALWLRDETTGQRYVGISGESDPRPAFTLGADVARVVDSAYFPAADGVVAEKMRARLRAGVDARLGMMGVFYGVTWLSEEFEGQPEGQVLGSLRLRVNF